MKKYYEKTLEKQKSNFSTSVLLHMKTRVNLKYPANGCLWKHFFASNSTQTPSNLIYLTIFVTLRPFTQFQPKIRAIKLQKKAKNCLTR